MSKLKTLEIKHDQYWSDKPEGNKYEGKVSFFDGAGNTVEVKLTQSHMAAITSIVADAVIDGAESVAHDLENMFHGTEPE